MVGIHWFRCIAKRPVPLPMLDSKAGWFPKIIGTAGLECSTPKYLSRLLDDFQHFVCIPPVVSHTHTPILEYLTQSNDFASLHNIYIYTYSSSSMSCTFEICKTCRWDAGTGRDHRTPFLTQEGGPAGEAMSHQGSLACLKLGYL